MALWVAIVAPKGAKTHPKGSILRARAPFFGEISRQWTLAKPPQGPWFCSHLPGPWAPGACFFRYARLRRVLSCLFRLGVGSGEVQAPKSEPNRPQRTPKGSPKSIKNPIKTDSGTPRGAAGVPGVGTPSKIHQKSMKYCGNADPETRNFASIPSFFHSNRG